MTPLFLGLMIGFTFGAATTSPIIWHFATKLARMEQNARWRKMLAGRHAMTVPEAVVRAQTVAEGGVIES